MSDPLRIEITVARRTPTKTIYRASLDGQELVEHADPIFASCRVLAAKGLSGPAEFWHVGASSPCMRLSVEVGAGLAAAEGERQGPRITQFREFERFDDEAEIAVAA